MIFRFQGDRACAPLSLAWLAAQARIETCGGWDGSTRRWLRSERAEQRRAEQRRQQAERLGYTVVTE